MDLVSTGEGVQAHARSTAIHTAPRSMSLPTLLPHLAPSVFALHRFIHSRLFPFPPLPISASTSSSSWTSSRRHPPRRPLPLMPSCPRRSLHPAPTVAVATAARPPLRGRPPLSWPGTPLLTAAAGGPSAPPPSRPPLSGPPTARPPGRCPTRPRWPSRSGQRRPGQPRPEGGWSLPCERGAARSRR